MCSWWWVEEPPETCRVSVKINKLKKCCILLAVICNFWNLFTPPAKFHRTSCQCDTGVLYPEQKWLESEVNHSVLTATEVKERMDLYLHASTHLRSVLFNEWTAKTNLLGVASNRNEYQQYFLGDKGGRCVGLTTLPPSCTDCLDIWESQPPGNLRVCPGL